MTMRPQVGESGPFFVDQLRPGDPYELSNGHPILCLPKGDEVRRARSISGGVLASDLAVQTVGVDVGFSPSPEILRAPDLSVGSLPDEPGWVHGAPPLAVEYADTGQDEDELDATLQADLAACGDLALLEAALRQAATASAAEILAALRP